MLVIALKIEYIHSTLVFMDWIIVNCRLKIIVIKIVLIVQTLAIRLKGVSFRLTNSNMLWIMHISMRRKEIASIVFFKYLFLFCFASSLDF